MTNNVLTPEQLVELLDLLNQDKSLETIAAKVHSAFPRNEHFKVGCALYLLLQDRLLPGGLLARLSAFYVLYDLYASEPLASNPFLPMFIDTLAANDTTLATATVVPSITTSTPPSSSTSPTTATSTTATSSTTSTTPTTSTLSPTNTQQDKDGGIGNNGPVLTSAQISAANVERSFLIYLLSSPPKELTKKTPKEVKTAVDRKVKLPMPDLNSLRKLYLDRQPQAASPFKRAGISAVIPDPVDDYGIPSRKKSHTNTQIPPNVEKRLKTFQQHPFEPLYIRPPPPLYDPQPNEVLWLTPDIFPHKVLWDPTMSAGNNRIAELRALMQKAFEEPLTQADQQQLTSDLEEDTKRVYICGLTPKRLPSLVENNPIIAIDCLVRLMSSSQITEYFSVLVNMEMSLHSMEVVNRLTTVVELPTEFVHLYISNCISSCENVSDKFMKNRLVRLVCVFLTSLIRNKIINVKDLFVEVQSFCIEFSRIREAAGLFRLLKTLEQNNTPTAGSAGSGGNGAGGSGAAGGGGGGGGDAAASSSGNDD
eukprot:TRINITY_DN4743_c0_g2_i1.p1 TRINITY_DN4743_c0_g2~~TRINITY_DN4743_c0_g2_i1.p1  ORF type:complete len:537 (+),score=124.56 TRINITY_DN4743_c0_g2_i1:110-1720(+)